MQIDEAIIKNYIKANKYRILKWISEFYQHQILSIIKQFTMVHGVLESTTHCPIKGTHLQLDQAQRNLVNYNQKIVLKSKG